MSAPTLPPWPKHLAERTGIAAPIIAPIPWVDNGPQCDFCGHSLTGTYTAFEVTGPIDRIEWGTVPTWVHLTGWWAACKRCEPLVRERSWRKVADRVMARRRAAGAVTAATEGMQRSGLAELYLQLDAVLDGTETRRRAGVA